MFIVAAAGLLLAGLREAADALHVADDTGEVVKIRAMTFGAFMEIAFVDVATFVAYRVGNIEGEVVAAFLRGHAEQLADRPPHGRNSCCSSRGVRGSRLHDPIWRVSRPHSPQGSSRS